MEGFWKKQLNAISGLQLNHHGWFPSPRLLNPDSGSITAAKQASWLNKSLNVIVDSLLFTWAEVPPASNAHPRWACPSCNLTCETVPKQRWEVLWLSLKLQSNYQRSASPALTGCGAWADGFELHTARKEGRCGWVLRWCGCRHTHTHMHMHVYTQPHWPGFVSMPLSRWSFSYLFQLVFRIWASIRKIQFYGLCSVGYGNSTV